MSDHPFRLTGFCRKNGVLPTLETSFLFRFQWNLVGMCLIVVAWSLLNADMHEWPPVPLDCFLLKNGVLPTLDTSFLLLLRLVLATVSNQSFLWTKGLCGPVNYHLPQRCAKTQSTLLIFSLSTSDAYQLFLTVRFAEAWEGRR